MNGACFLVDGLVAAHRVEQDVECIFGENDVIAELDRVDFFHQIAENRALAAARGDRAFFHLFFEPPKGRARRDRNRRRFPVHLHRGDFIDGFRQALVAQITDRERLGRLAEGHQRDDFALVHVERERMLARDRRRHGFAALVDRLDFEGEGFRSVGELEAVRRLHPPM